MASRFCALGPAIDSPHSSLVSGRTATPSSGRCAANQRNDILRRAGAEDVEALVINLGDGEIADELAVVVEHRGERDAAGLRDAVGENLRQPGFGARPVTSYLA
jgi:hypothetical protein